MRLNRFLAVAIFCLFSGGRTDAELIPSADGLTVYDTILHVTWLANANLAGTPAGQFGVSNIAPNGAMSYQTAQQWVAALNAQNGGAGYLGHNNWQLPATPSIDTTCSSTGPNGDSFGIGCVSSALGSLYSESLGLKFPNTAVPIADNTFGPFKNFQPYLYWSDTISVNATQGYHSFSFATGWQGANIDKHFMYALPMIQGKLPAAPAGSGNALQPSGDGKTVYDPIANVTWLADANLAKTQTFTAQCTNKDGTLCINPDGSMSHTTAEAWVAAMNAAAYLGQKNWQLPPIPDTDTTCSDQNYGFHCTGSPLGVLYYTQLKLAQGTPVVSTPNTKVGPFSNLQPYLYWSCLAAEGSPVLCQSAPPVPGFGWSFSFGNGFEGTDIVNNGLYAMVYFAEMPRHRAAHH